MANHLTRVRGLRGAAGCSLFELFFLILSEPTLPSAGESKAPINFHNFTAIPAVASLRFLRPKRIIGRRSTQRGRHHLDWQVSATCFTVLTSKTYRCRTLEAPPGGVASIVIHVGLPVSSTSWPTWGL